MERVNVEKADRPLLATWGHGPGGKSKMADNPMELTYAFQKAPRCSATSKRSGIQCKSPAERGKRVCRFHGARGGAPKGEAHGMYKHGRFTGEARAARRESEEAPEQFKSPHLDGVTVDTNWPDGTVSNCQNLPSGGWSALPGVAIRRPVAG